MTPLETQLAEALRRLYDDDRDFLGGDNECAHCGHPNRDGKHADWCSTALAKTALAEYDRMNQPRQDY